MKNYLNVRFAELTQRIQMAKPRTVTQYFLSGANSVGVLRIGVTIITIFTA